MSQLRGLIWLSRNWGHHPASSRNMANRARFNKAHTHMAIATTSYHLNCRNRVSITRIFFHSSYRVGKKGSCQIQTTKSGATALEALHWIFRTMMSDQNTTHNMASRSSAVWVLYSHPSERLGNSSTTISTMSQIHLARTQVIPQLTSRVPNTPLTMDTPKASSDPLKNDISNPMANTWPTCLIQMKFVAHLTSSIYSRCHVEKTVSDLPIKRTFFTRHPCNQDLNMDSGPIAHKKSSHPRKNPNGHLIEPTTLPSVVSSR